MSLWTKIKWGLGAAVGILLSVLHIRAKRATRQRDQARTERDSAKRSEQATERKSEKSSAVAQAQNKSRQEAAQADEQIEEHRRNRDRSGGLNNDRLQ